MIHGKPALQNIAKRGKLQPVGRGGNFGGYQQTLTLECGHEKIMDASRVPQYMTHCYMCPRQGET